MNKIDGLMFRQMILGGARNLKKNADYVDSLNVFPVPDGDTGTNMNLSMSSGAAEVEPLDDKHIGNVGKHFSKGLLMGARGNSGVILSQLFRGFSKAIEGKEDIDADEFIEALKQGVKTAYKAVMKPVEGTILTVAKDAGEKAEEFKDSDASLVDVMSATLEEAKASLKRTPELLAVLKEVGVVDSGGQGLVYVYEGFLSALTGEEIEADESQESALLNADSHDHNDDFDDFMSVDDIEFGYCTEFMVRFEDEKREFKEDEFREEMSEFGDSLLVINDDEIVKVHVHTETPGEAFTYAATYGELIKMKVENMREQFRTVHGEKNTAAAEKESYDTAVITVSSGEGINELFKSLSVTHVINGGQTMNPATEDIVNVIKDADVKQVIILPNNKNIIMAAEQAVKVLDVPAAVVKSTSIPEGLTSMLSFNPEAELEDNERAMSESLNHVQTGQVTYSVRDTKIDGIEIKKDQHMGIADGKIITANDSKKDTLHTLISEMINEETEIITILIGEGGSEEEVEAVVNSIEGSHEDVEFEIHNGAQPVYSYLISVE
ncbi:MAG: DAK2 domain-containing protein [Jeotgalicoccus halophilus]|nr:DAK2 domain-containing protein [Jeotgalicoccus aerolatus]